jgi:hypothetical protein
MKTSNELAATTQTNRRHKQTGFSLLETAIAIVVLTFGVLALAAILTEGVLHVATVQYHLIAKEKAAEAIESVFTARDTRVLTWAQIQNLANGGVFLDGAQPMNLPGPDALVNTGDENLPTAGPDGIAGNADDGPGLETIVLPGPDNILGNADDELRALTDFTREIQITNLGPNLRQLVVIVRYRVGRLQLNYTLTTLISSYA